MILLRALWRLVRLVLHGARGLAICAFVFPFLDTPARMQRVGRWSVQMLGVLGIRVTSSGRPHAGPVLYIANHVSWLDIMAIDALQPARFVSKADVRHWPLIGYLVACGGTLFIERERKRDALRVVHHIAETLRAGEIVAVFPEGTTSEGQGLLPFHANLLQAAIVVGAPVQPIALRYRDSTSAVSPAVAYVGDTSLVQSIWWIAQADGLAVQVDFLDVHASAGQERRALAQGLHDALGRHLAGLL